MMGCYATRRIGMSSTKAFDMMRLSPCFVATLYTGPGNASVRMSFLNTLQYKRENTESCLFLISPSNE